MLRLDVGTFRSKIVLPQSPMLSSRRTNWHNGMTLHEGHSNITSLRHCRETYVVIPHGAGTDALDHAPINIDDTPEPSPAVFTGDNGPTAFEIMSRISSRVPPRIQRIAQMALVDGLTLTKIAHRTGRSRPGPKKELRKIITNCIRRVFGRQKSERDDALESIA